MTFCRVLPLIAYAGLVSCSPVESAVHYMQRRTGLVLCPAVKIAEPTESKDTPDVSHFAFHLEGRCKSEFLESAFASSGGECAEMLPKNGSCIYFGNGRPSVIVEGRPSGGDFRVTTY